MKCLKEKILLLYSSINNLTSQLNTAEVHTSKLCNNIQPDYITTVEKDARRKVEELIVDLCRSEFTIDKISHILDTKIDQYSEDK